VAELTALYRPVGRKELELIRETRFRSFPPRLPAQPFFYPVLNEEYATQIACDWNTKDDASGFEGHVLRFHIRSEFLSRYDIRIVGSSQHQECWIPAAELGEFKRAIEGTIEMVRSFDRPDDRQEPRLKPDS
jgi:hypothetical protein